MSDFVSDGPHDLARTCAAEAAKGCIAVIGTVASALTLNNVVALATLIYILLQSAHLLWRWRRDAGGK